MVPSVPALRAFQTAQSAVFKSSRFKEDAGAFKTFSSDFSRRFKVQKFLTLVHDRRYSRHWTFEAKKRFGLCVLDYVLLKNDVRDLRRHRRRLERVWTCLTLDAGFTDHFIEQPVVDELGGVDRPLDFLRRAGEVEQQLISVDANLAVHAK